MVVVLKRCKRLGVILVTAIALSVVLVGTFAAYHHIMIAVERKRVLAPGRLVTVAGRSMHIYTEGQKQDNRDPTIILLSGSGEPSPMYNYKILYSKLSNSYRVAVVEKFGYGYSDVSNLSRDIVTLVEQDREALQKAGEKPPYALMPHSMSALEALYWSKKYPSEVCSIIGLDMAVLDTYQDKDNMLKIKFNWLVTRFGLHRIPCLYQISHRGLNRNEFGQQKYLVYRQVLNNDVYRECQSVYWNAQVVKKLGPPTVPILMFSSNLSKDWQISQDSFSKSSARITKVDLTCGHYIHYYQSDLIAALIREYLGDLPRESRP